jgi:hypothetical protein
LYVFGLHARDLFSKLPHGILPLGIAV